ncbi:hypothetical protein BDW02DRAFT_433052 [Decorospora gaudefroyi]|uniref:Uncharacterized protein n=1 Tax=Decorospora gaudefroyi TaxID=184978 RepID=A0A6A5KCZ6_9PLEO|nr:hypothetical protein BDW02DRAFT_433052 [Decorospora gaudefroyi]
MPMNHTFTMTSRPCLAGVQEERHVLVGEPSITQWLGDTGTLPRAALAPTAEAKHQLPSLHYQVSHDSLISRQSRRPSLLAMTTLPVNANENVRRPPIRVSSLRIKSPNSYSRDSAGNSRDFLKENVVHTATRRVCLYLGFRPIYLLHPPYHAALRASGWRQSRMSDSESPY